LFANVTFYSFF